MGEHVSWETFQNMIIYVNKIRSINIKVFIINQMCNINTKRTAYGTV